MKKNCLKWPDARIRGRASACARTEVSRGTKSRRNSGRGIGRRVRGLPPVPALVGVASDVGCLLRLLFTRRAAGHGNIGASFSQRVGNAAAALIFFDGELR